MIWGGANIIIIQIRYTINETHLNHPETIPPQMVGGKVVLNKTSSQCWKGWGLLCSAQKNQKLNIAFNLCESSIPGFWPKRSETPLSVCVLKYQVLFLARQTPFLKGCCWQLSTFYRNQYWLWAGISGFRFFFLLHPFFGAPIICLYIKIWQRE